MAMINKPKVKEKKHGKAKKRASVSEQKAKNNGRAKPKPKVKNVKKVKAVEVIPSETEVGFDEEFADESFELDDIESDLVDDTDYEEEHA